MLQWRMRADYRDKTFLLARLVDKAIFSILMMTLYLGIGNNYSNDNALNIGAILFMWTILPAFTAVGCAGQLPALGSRVLLADLT